MEEYKTRWKNRKHDGETGNKMEEQETRWRNRKQDGGTKTQWRK